jgi:hypothetical protein
VVAFRLLTGRYARGRVDAAGPARTLPCAFTCIPRCKPRWPRMRGRHCCGCRAECSAAPRCRHRSEPRRERLPRVGRGAKDPAGGAEWYGWARRCGGALGATPRDQEGLDNERATLMALADDLPRKPQDKVVPLRATRYVRSWRIGIATRHGRHRTGFPPRPTACGAPAKAR